MNWISTKDKLPEEGKYVLARHNRETWIDNSDQENVNCVVVKLVKGISMNERKLMEQGKIPSQKQSGVHYDGTLDKPIYTNTERWKVFKSEDEFGNNLVPYKWNSFGVDSFFGQTITHWTPIKPLDK